MPPASGDWLSATAWTLTDRGHVIRPSSFGAVSPRTQTSRRPLVSASNPATGYGRMATTCYNRTQAGCHLGFWWGGVGRRRVSSISRCHMSKGGAVVSICQLCGTTDQYGPGFKVEYCDNCGKNVCNLCTSNGRHSCKPCYICNRRNVKVLKCVMCEQFCCTQDRSRVNKQACKNCVP